MDNLVHTVEEQKVTVNADKRYYLDEGNVSNTKGFLETLDSYNRCKISLYNVMYAEKYDANKGILTQKNITYPRFLKDRFGTNDYYNSSLYSEVTGVLKSQKELHELNLANKQVDISNRETKIQSTIEQLDKKLAVKKSIVIYMKTGTWEKPYPKCSLVVSGNRISGFHIPETDIHQYEYDLDRKIKQLSTRIKQLQEGKKRMEQSYERMKNNPPKKAMFGSRDFYKKKDTVYSEDNASWKQEFHDKRYHSMSLTGRHTSKYCNYLCKYNRHKKELVLVNMDGTETVFKDFQVARFVDEFEALFTVDPHERQSICYTFKLEKDSKGRQYIIPSVTFNLPKKRVNTGVDDGCVSIDLNHDHIALTDLDIKGNLLYHTTFPFKLEGLTTGQAQDAIGRVMSLVADYCERHHKCLLMEDISIKSGKAGLKYGNATRNRKITTFAYKKMTACALSQAYKHNFTVYFVNPAYTSQSGKMALMRKHGLSIHESAAYAIGLKGMGLHEKLQVPEHLKRCMTAKQQEADLWAQWKTVTSKMKDVRTHAFYLNLPKAEAKTFTKLKNWIKNNDQVYYQAPKPV